MTESQAALAASLSDLILPLVQDYENQIGKIHASQSTLVQNIDDLSGSLGEIMSAPDYPELKVYMNRLQVVKKRITTLDSSIGGIAARLSKLQTMVSDHERRSQKALAPQSSQSSSPPGIVSDDAVENSGKRPEDVSNADDDDMDDEEKKYMDALTSNSDES
eukprot:ANDGO_08040.mRNA.1 hypothetical protein CAOG_06066